jgi:RHS repeat-associated protein
MAIESSSDARIPLGACAAAAPDPSDFCKEWNAENRLTRVTKSGIEVARFSYDALGRRVEKVAGGVTHGYVYDSNHVAEERLSTGGVIRYSHGPGIDDWLSRQNADGSTTYFVADDLGNIAAEMNGAGQVTLARTYDAWGNLDAPSAAVGGPSYAGRWWEPDLQLYDYRARWYDPKVGRFLSQDPLGLGDGLNRYAYVHNDPVGQVDPFGLAAMRINHYPGWKLPKIYNLCDVGESVVFWDYSPFNPNTQEGKYIGWKNAFIDECYKVEGFQPGRDYRARVAPVNPNMVAQSDWPSTAIGVCCEHKCKQ